MLKKENYQKRLLTVRDLSQLLGISPRTIYNGVHRRTKKPFPIPPKRIGRLVRFDIKDVNKFLDAI